MMILQLLNTLVAATSACTPSSLNINGWININIMVVLAFLSIVSMVYALSNLFPSQRREQLRRILIAEYGESMVSIFIIAILVSFAYATCSAGASLSGLGSSYVNIFQADSVYVGNLVFGTGTALSAQLSLQGYLLQVDAQIVKTLLDTVLVKLPPITISGSSLGAQAGTGGVSFQLGAKYGGDLANVYNTYANVYTAYAGMVVITFGVLLMLFLLLSVISSVVLPFILPFTIVMRSLAFTGPKLREAANALLALSVAIYFVLPLTISMNAYVVNWMYCGSSVSASSCNPYASYLGSYSLSNIPVSSFFTQNSTQLTPGSSIDVPTNFFSSVIAGAGGASGAFKSTLMGIVALPQQVSNITNSVAQYLFQGIVLIALDFVITMGFAQGLNKGLNAIPSLFGAGSFWGGE